MVVVVMARLAVVCLLVLSSVVLRSQAGFHGTCRARAPQESFASSAPGGCATCSCSSSPDAVFYDPCGSETCCSALTGAEYTVTFTGTWTGTCQPDYYFPSAHWSPLTGVSHDHTYEVWNACMVDVSEGVAMVSQTGSVSQIESEYLAQGDSVGSVLRGTVIVGDGSASGVLTVDCDHPYITVLTMLAPSVDRMVGVAGLKMTSEDGEGWKKSLHVCAELFSTATKSERVDVRNSIQAMNCSFGYFSFVRTSEDAPRIAPPLPDSCTCQSKIPEECPDMPVVDTKSLSTCCCETSKNARFYLPKGPNPICSAEGEVTYDVHFQSTWTAEAHPDYYFDTAHWSPPTGCSHDPQYEVWNACMQNVSEGVALVSQIGATTVIEQEYTAQGSLVKDVFKAQRVDKDGDTSAKVTLNSSYHYVSVLSMLAPSVDRMVGVSRLDLCNGDRWKCKVRVCCELFSTATKSDRVADRNSIQSNNCSFCYFEFTRNQKDICYNTGLDVSGLTQSFCRDQDFIMLARILRARRVQSDFCECCSGRAYRLTVDVRRVYGNKLNAVAIQRGERVDVIACGVPPSFLNRKGNVRKTRALLMGRRDCDTEQFIIDDAGYIDRYSRAMTSSLGTACAAM